MHRNKIYQNQKSEADGTPALHYAASTGHGSRITLLVKYGVTGNQLDADGHTAFYRGLNSNRCDLALHVLRDLCAPHRETVGTLLRYLDPMAQEDQQQ